MAMVRGNLQTTSGATPEALSAWERVHRRALLSLSTALNSLNAYPALEITHHTVTVDHIPAGLRGFTITQVSDLHVGPGAWVPRNWQLAAAAVRESRPDLIVNTGDFLQFEPPPEKARLVFEQFLRAAEPGDEEPRTIAILGNHDYYAGDDAVRVLTDELAGEGVHVLTNELTTVHHNGAGMTVAGIVPERPGYEDVIDALLESARPRIVLVHRPDEAEMLPAGSADLVLAGHTHGGQVTVPLLEPFIVRKFCGSEYVQGWYRVNDNRLYVNRGIGCTGYPVRFRARPEVSLFRLTD
jgi:uncharacterized protein